MGKWGYLILLMGNFNDYIIIHRSRQYFSKLGLRKLVMEKNGSEGPGSTRSTRNNNAIGGTWRSSGLNTTSCGYFQVNYGLKSDHRLIWVKTPLVNALGDKTILSKTPSTRKLQLNHPDGQHKYILKLQQITRKQNLIPRLRALENHQNSSLTPEAIKEYKEIDKIIVKAKSKSNSSI